MGTVKRKMEFISMYSIGAYESWLSDLAASGLFLKKFGFMSCLFEKAEPARVEYRIDISKERLSKDRIVMYEDCGWKYIARVSVKISDSLIRYKQRQRSLSKCQQIAENMMKNSRNVQFA